MKKTGIWLLLAAVICLLPTAAATEAEWVEWLESERFWEEPAAAADLGLPADEPIPLYGAPFAEALPLDPIPAGEPFKINGALQAQTWVMAETADARTGWIRVDPARCDLPDSDMYILRMLCRVARETGASLTPGGPAVLNLQEGDTVIAMLADSEAGWVYFETDLDGKPVWLFGDPSTLEKVSMTEVDGDTVRIREGVTILGDVGMSESRWIPDEPGDEENGHWEGFVHTEIRPGDIAEGGVDLGMIFGYGRPAAAIEFPKSLRILGDEAIVTGELLELRLPEALEYASRYGSFYSTDVRRMILPAGYTADVPDGQYMTVLDYAVEAGNPCYKSVDGVLFSADGKTLLRYPNGRKDLHYDVPAGTEVIAEHAFDDDLMNLPLKTLSLPIGLKRIESFAFAGCGRLQSLTIPLTVTEISDSSFYACVSLERLSLPPGLSVNWYGSARQADFTWYNGDNGSTEQSGTQRTTFRSYYARVASLSEAKEETIWMDAACTEPAQDIADGTKVYVVGGKGSSAQIKLQEWRTNSWNNYSYWGWGNATYWIPFACLEADTAGSTLFRMTGAVLNATGEHFDEYDVELDHGKAIVYIPEAFDPEEYDWKYREETYTREEITLLRDGDNSRTLAFLCAPDDAPIPILDAPGGSETGHVYNSEQAIVLEQRDGWALIRTLRQTGWVPEENVWVAEAE